MHLEADTLDDLLRATIDAILTKGTRIRPKRGKVRDIFGALLHLKRPRARLSRTESKGTPFSAIGELMWYLAGTNRLEFIEYYLSRYREDSEDGRTIRGAYGPRLFRMRGQNQIENVINLLKQRRDSRRAVIQLFDATDLESPSFREVPCTCALQFAIRSSRLEMMATMRSNDAYLGLPHDVFAFTMLQEIIARSLGVDLGSYRHAVGSLHLYERDVSKARAYLERGWQTTTVSMPKMPTGDPWPEVRAVVRAERRLRSDDDVRESALPASDYWRDFVLLLDIYRRFKRGRNKEIGALKAQLTTRIFDTFIDKKAATRYKPRKV